jgi:His-Xaa-Ser system protein HxsD
VEPISRSGSEITLLVDEAIYARTAVLKSCYWFTDRCFIFIYRHDEQHLAIRLAAKSNSPGLDILVGEFENALLDHQLRFEIARETATLRELIVAKAFAEGDVLGDPPVGDDRDPVEQAAEHTPNGKEGGRL